MSAAVKELPVQTLSKKEDPKEIVAVVLADGSVRELRGPGAPDANGHRLAAGSLSGPDWILWWQRRSFAGR